MTTHSAVTGGGGFLGSAVCRRLLAAGARVTCVDSFVTGRRRNIADLVDHPHFRLVERDVRDGLEDLGAVDEIWNLASPAAPPAYQKDPIGTLLTNVVGMAHVLDWARACGARVVQASTSEVYGDPDLHPQIESYRGAVSTSGPRACYDEGKRAAEALCFDYRRAHEVDVKVARIFNTYGPGMDPQDGRVVSNFIVRALRGLPLELFGDGGQTRSFCYRDDLVEGLFRLMRTGPDFGGPVNLGNPEEFTIRALAELVIALTGSRAGLVWRDLPADDPRQRQPDIGLAMRTLSWQPQVSLREGLVRTIAYFEMELRAEERVS